MRTAALLACLALTPWADPPPAPLELPADLREPQPVDGDHPLPQDKARIAALRKERLAFARELAAEPFEKTEGAKAPWAAQARTLLGLYAERFNRPTDGAPGALEGRFYDALAAAEAAGAAADPFVNYLVVRFLEPHRAASEWKTVPPERGLAGYRAVLAALPAMPTPAPLKMHLAWNTYVHLNWAALGKKAEVDPKDIAEARRLFWSEFEAAARDPRPEAREQVVRVAELVALDASLTGTKDRAAGWREVEAALKAANAPEWTRATAEGLFLIAYAWDARGRGFAGEVTPEGWKLMGERLSEARERLDAAWKLDPDCATPAVGRIQIEMGAGGGDRDAMELWFTRAMTADPDNFAACSAKREWLQPKWHGSHEEAQAFTKQCFRTQNWHAGLPFALRVPSLGFDIGTEKDALALGRARVSWRHFLAVSRAYARFDPADRATMSRTARVCSLAGRPAEAAEFFAAAGSPPWPGTFIDRAEYERMRDAAEAAREAGKK